MKLNYLVNFHVFPYKLTLCSNFYILSSTISSGMNSMTAVFITDFIRPGYTKIYKKHINERFAFILSKMICKLAKKVYYILTYLIL